MILSVKMWFNECCLQTAFSSGCHGDMQMKLKTLSSFSGNLQYNRGTKCRWKDITTHAKMTWKQVQINGTQNVSRKRNGIMEWSVWSRSIQVDLMKKISFNWMSDRGTHMDEEMNRRKDILFRERGKTSGEQRVRRKSKEFNTIASRHKTRAQIKMWYITPFYSV